jgi:thiamine pyrophosphate-dependent acetolactate synthase large subunit-like protein
MNPQANVRDASRTAGPRFVLDRRKAVPALIGRHEDFLHIAGLAGTAYDLTALTSHGPHCYVLGGAMGAACMMGLGLALGRPDKRVLVTTGDGELLMSLGALATIGVMNPPNLSIICVDNGHYCETGDQETHTNRGVDLERIAQGAGIRFTRTVETEADYAEGARTLRHGQGAAFVLLRVNPNDELKFKRNMDGADCRKKFRGALLRAPSL